LELVTKNAVPFDESSEWAHNPTSNWFHWTPQSDRAIFATMDGHVYWLYTDPFRIDALNLPTERDLTEYGQRYTIQGPVGVQWMPNGRTGFVMWGGMVWEYDLSTNTLSDAPTDYDISMVISPSGAFIAQIESCDPAADYDRQHRRIQPYTNCIFDLVRQERTAVFSAKSSYVEYNLGGLVRWHPDGEWAILMEEMGTRYASLGSSVVHRFGFHIARFNQSAHGRNINAYWLPENVPID
jgi:hypothetical protein